MAEVETNPKVISTYWVHQNWIWRKDRPSKRWIDERCMESVSKKDLDAALRRAKAEVWMDMQYWVRNETIEAMRKYIDARIAELEADARAAQIEEGE